MNKILSVCRKALMAVSLLAFMNWPVLADDGGISFGGSPHLLKGHATVSMKDEVVNMDVQAKVVKVDCKFVFHNDGAACTVRVGFPDQGLGAAEPYQGFPLPKKNLKATFLTYESWVDGKKVPTHLVPTDDRGLFWHTKTVTFKGHGDTNIRDTYTLPPGMQMTSENGMFHQTYYVLHTGASWLGPIGNAEINVKFAPDVVPVPLQAKELSALPDHDLQHMKWTALPKETVIWQGLAKPVVDGSTLHFTRRNFKPSKSDDVHLYYAFHLNTNMPGT